MKPADGQPLCSCQSTKGAAINTAITPPVQAYGLRRWIRAPRCRSSPTTMPAPKSTIVGLFRNPMPTTIPRHKNGLESPRFSAIARSTQPIAQNIDSKAGMCSIVCMRR